MKNGKNLNRFIFRECSYHLSEYAEKFILQTLIVNLSRSEDIDISNLAKLNRIKT